MPKSGFRFFVCLFCALILAGALPVLRSNPARAEGEQQTQVIELTAKKYEYSQSAVHVKAGSKVQLKITALDHDHGFKVSLVADGAAAGSKPGLLFTAPQECWQLKKGETTTIEFVAQTPGTYSFQCCHFCGLGHKNMKSKIVVD